MSLGDIADWHMSAAYMATGIRDFLTDLEFPDWLHFRLWYRGENRPLVMEVAEPELNPDNVTKNGRRQIRYFYIFL
jgi:hypothetical protein